VTSERLAIIYATGEIGGGQGSDVAVGSDRLAETIERVRKNDQIKAVVLRVNSPGGDALASDVIWREMNLLKDEKPVIVSMGDVAASGGYWISCASDKIIADPTTLTGSIGVFGVIPNIGGFMENKIGMSFDHVKTNENAGFPSILRPLNDYERMVLESKIENIYSLFLDRVSENRNMSAEAVDEIGEGRVWSGIDAKRLGLIDDFGGLCDAVELAGEIAGLSEYRILELPVQKDPVEQMLEELTAGTYQSFLKAELGVFYKDYMTARSAMKLNGVQALLPVSISIE
jgi:protease-4